MLGTLSLKLFVYQCVSAPTRIFHCDHGRVKALAFSTLTRLRAALDGLYLKQLLLRCGIEVAFARITLVELVYRLVLLGCLL